ncbi:unnamed protein product [Paramecium sonneborni]|uniref:Uncharacterized protein n=1 Tax=Paramecium sonneborni TaxID=65129 RepID=A0A8S1N3F6_9CILI|nr:unnamed protein product [Paramecium sonneborni]
MHRNNSFLFILVIYQQKRVKQSFVRIQNLNKDAILWQLEGLIDKNLLFKLCQNICVAVQKQIISIKFNKELKEINDKPQFQIVITDSYNCLKETFVNIYIQRLKI